MLKSSYAIRTFRRTLLLWGRLSAALPRGLFGTRRGPTDHLLFYFNFPSCLFVRRNSLQGWYPSVYGSLGVVVVASLAWLIWTVRTFTLVKHNSSKFIDDQNLRGQSSKTREITIRLALLDTLWTSEIPIWHIWKTSGSSGHGKRITR